MGPLPPFSNRAKLDCLFVLIVVQLTLHIGCIECRSRREKKIMKKRFSIIPGTIKANL